LYSGPDNIINVLCSRFCGTSKGKIVDLTEKESSFTVVGCFVDGVVMSGGTEVEGWGRESAINMLHP
jgi:hypothetical protein